LAVFSRIEDYFLIIQWWLTIGLSLAILNVCMSKTGRQGTQCTLGLCFSVHSKTVGYSGSQQYTVRWPKKSKPLSVIIIKSY